MERSGNFYKAIRLGYILISILIGCMAYNSLYEWQEIEALELGNKKIDELRKEINNINIQMIKFSLLEQKEIYIETERIIIRNFKQKDAEGLLEYLSNPRVNCFAGDRLCSEEAAWAYMQYSPKDMLRYAVSLKKDDFIIGDVFALRENEDTYNVGWHFNKRFEGKGFACEAAAGLLDYLFREAGARRIYGFVEDDNIRSKRLCERLGMRREGCFKEFVTFVNNPDGSPKYEDTCVYAILEKEWNTIRQW
jgi:ribosomal-protein-alanine N-acetyltransferase